MEVIAKTGSDIYIVEVTAAEIKGLGGKKPADRNNFIGAMVDLSTLFNRLEAAENATASVQQLRNKVQRTLNVLDDVLNP
jgi:hypothetical protein